MTVVMSKLNVVKIERHRHCHSIKKTFYAIHPFDANKRGEEKSDVKHHSADLNN